jgi:hypothetical protein
MIDDPISEFIENGKNLRPTDPDTGCGRLLLIFGVVVFCGIVSLCVSGSVTSRLSGSTVSAAVLWPVLSFAALWSIGEWRKQNAKRRPPPIPPPPPSSPRAEDDDSEQ